MLRHASVAICAGAYPESEVRRIAAEYMPPVIQVPPGCRHRRFTPLDSDASRRGAHVAGTPRRRLPRQFVLAPRAAQGHGHTDPREPLDWRQYPNLQVAIGGPAATSSDCEKLARRLEAPVTFLGRVPDDDLPRVARRRVTSW